MAKVLKKCREYLLWVQNSVLEGELTEMRLRQLKREPEIIDNDDDSVIIYRFESLKYSLEVMGREKGGMSMEVSEDVVIEWLMVIRVREGLRNPIVCPVEGGIV